MKSRCLKNLVGIPLYYIFFSFLIFFPCLLYIYNCRSIIGTRGLIISISRHLSPLTINQFIGHDNTKQSTAITTIGTRITPTVSSSLGNLHFAGFKVREVNSCNSIPLFLPEGQQWIKSRTGETVAMEKLYAFGPPWQNQRNTYMNDTQLPQDSVQLPDRRITEEFARGYSSHILSLVFPTIDKVLFEDTISLAYHQGSFQPTGHASAKACIYAFLAFASVFNIYGRTGTRLPLESEAYALKAQSLIPQVFQDITTESLQTAIMLVSNLRIHIFAFLSV